VTTIAASAVSRDVNLMVFLLRGASAGTALSLPARRGNR